MIPEGREQALCADCEAALSSDAKTIALAEPGAMAAKAIPEGVELPVIPQVEIIELLGEGGMGAVFRARQTHLDRIVAVKVMRKELSLNPAFTERFEREARALAKLNHPNIVTLHDFGESDGVYYFVMEFVEGVNLRQAIRSGEMQPLQMIEIVCSVCDALQYAHQKGIVHRDIKPENVLLDMQGHVKIADFGLAHIVDDRATAARLTSSGQVMGTLHYMAPEQVEQPTGTDHRVDIYASGVLLYEMLTGELPIGNFRMPSSKGADQRFDDVVLHALEKDPGNRYQSASELHAELKRISSGGIAIPVDEDAVLLPQLRMVGWGMIALCLILCYLGISSGTVESYLPWIFIAGFGGQGLRLVRHSVIKAMKSGDAETWRNTIKRFKKSQRGMAIPAGVLFIVGAFLALADSMVFFILALIGTPFACFAATATYGIYIAKKLQPKPDSQTLHSGSYTSGTRS